ncbi:uncharacterized protein LOC62_04G005319 [Vanrija pseudolonga]|uniref:Uncharacterized protein n=1 Tax=Vanrija pseudolonga TaxID=143232 RepID=A0AAF0Y7T5_9TREE|nr:hypothetical protein LOC62_04G005319 [Vanrija pseudolonga]
MLQEVVIVLWPDTIWFTNADGTKALGVPGLLRALANVPYDTDRLIIVGLEDVSDPGDNTELPWAARKQTILDEVEANKQLRCPNFQIHALTRQECWASLGPGDKTIIGTWYAESRPWNQPRVEH